MLKKDGNSLKTDRELSEIARIWYKEDNEIETVLKKLLEANKMITVFRMLVSENGGDMEGLINSELYQIDETTRKLVCSVNTSDLPFSALECDPRTNVDRIYPWHWHSYFQVVYVLEGVITYCLPSGTHRFVKGDIGFINVNVLHMFECESIRETRFVEFFIAPDFLCGSPDSAIYQRYLRPIVENPDFDIYHFDYYEDVTKDMADLLMNAFRCYQERKLYYEMVVHGFISSFWIAFLQHTEGYRMEHPSRQTTLRLQKMILYINDHYSEKLTLTQIAKAGLCSERECDRVFMQNLHISPLKYLQKLRLQQASILLLNPYLSITEIAHVCGFPDVSSFGKAFRGQYENSPREYRKMQTQVPSVMHGGRK